MQTPILDIAGLTTVFRIGGRDIAAVRDLDLTVAPGETVALVGESGSGKSVTSLSIMGLLTRRVGRIAAGTVGFRGKAGPAELTALDDEGMRRLRGNDICDGLSGAGDQPQPGPSRSARRSPRRRCCIHRGKSRTNRPWDRMRCGCWPLVEIPEPKRRADGNIRTRLSGGMRQRVTDRHGARLRPGAADRRRADHRARRHRPGADPRPPEAASRSETRHGHPVHHPQSRRRRRGRRPGGGDVCRPHRRTRVGGRSCSPDRRHPYTRGLLASVPKLGRPCGTR
jgi:peptide/nickel transport system ATP-binding protein